MEKKYSCYTKQGSWYFYASDDMDAMRLALFLSWRDNENFIRLERNEGSDRYSLCICRVDENKSFKTIN